MYSGSWQICILLTLTIGQTTCRVKEKGEISAMYATRGGRSHMEDYSIRIENKFGIGIYAVFDGHGGEYSANFAKKNFTEKFDTALDLYSNDPKKLKYADEPNGKINFEQMLIDFIADVESHLAKTTIERVHKSGTTCIIVIAEENLLTVANVGDSRAVMCDCFGVAVDLSVDHKPMENHNEFKRIMEAGGTVYDHGVWRVEGLSMSRSLGDHKRKKSKLILATPDIQTFDLNEYRPKFIILASDGVWDVLKSEDAVAFIRDHHLNDDDFGARALARWALKSKSKDNITVLIVVFKNGHYQVGAK